jgi:uncharacterized protein YbcV (DUF1398 family)
MFTLEQIIEIHDRLGSQDALQRYLRALRDVGVAKYDSYVCDGHSEYYGVDGQKLVGPALHETFAIAQAPDKEWFLEYMKQVENEGVGFTEMSRALADHGVERWSFDTEKLTITYLDQASNVLLAENVG